MTEFLRRKNAVVTGGSKNIGRDISLHLAKTSFGRAGDKTPEVRDYDVTHVAFGYRSDDENEHRRNSNLARTMREAGSDAIAIHADLVLPEERGIFVARVGEWASRQGGVDLSVLNAAGGLEEDVPEDYGNQINNVAQVSLVRGLTPFLAENPTIMLIESSWSERYPQLSGPVLPGYREKVSKTKKEGRDNVIELVERTIVPIGGRALVLAAGIVEGTGIARLMKMHYPEFYEEQDKIGNVVSSREVAETAVRIAHDPNLSHGHVEVVGTDLDELVARYPAETA